MTRVAKVHALDLRCSPVSGLVRQTKGYSFDSDYTNLVLPDFYKPGSAISEL